MEFLSLIKFLAELKRRFKGLGSICKILQISWAKPESSQWIKTLGWLPETQGSNMQNGVFSIFPYLFLNGKIGGSDSRHCARQPQVNAWVRRGPRRWSSSELDWSAASGGDDPMRCWGKSGGRHGGVNFQSGNWCCLAVFGPSKQIPPEPENFFWFLWSKSNGTL
jgi:hypothetical protein